MKNLPLYLLFVGAIIASCNRSIEVSSPDGRTTMTFELKSGAPFYSIVKDGQTAIASSRLGFALNNHAPFDGNFTIKRSTIGEFDEAWEQTWGEERYIRNHYRELTVELQEQTGDRRLLNIVFRLFDDGVGFRYVFPEQPNLKTFEITEERTAFALPDDYDIWSISAYHTAYFEGIYSKKPVSRLNDTVSTPVTIETGDGCYIAIHEANLTDYAKMNLYPVDSSATLNVDLTPWSTGVKVYAQTPFASPWRTIILADDLNALATSRLMLNLNEPCALDDVSWITPMKFIGVWWGMHIREYTWGQGAKHGATTKNVLRYIDFAARNRIPGVLVEGWNEGWDGVWQNNGELYKFTSPYPDFDIQKITAYAAQKGVELIGHHETGANTIGYEQQMEASFAYYKKLGIDAVKTGYVSRLLDKKERHGSQYGVRHYRKAIETAARYRIMIDNHEPVMPTGLQRTFPNLMTQEGIRGQEWDAYDSSNPPEHTTVLPFTRILAGPADFTFGTFKLTDMGPAKTRVNTTLAKQLALYVVMYSPLQMVSDMPENYEGKRAFEFIQVVPVDWDKTVVLDGRIGDYVVTARKDRHSDDWFVGAITDENGRDVQVDFSFLEPGRTYTAKIYKDGDGADWETNPYPVTIEEQPVDAASVLDLKLAPGGGAALWIRPDPEERGTAEGTWRIVPTIPHWENGRLVTAELRRAPKLLFSDKD
jgi:alpha-glucosidase